MCLGLFLLHHHPLDLGAVETGGIDRGVDSRDLMERRETRFHQGLSNFEED